MVWVGLSALAREAISTKGQESFAERVGAGPFDFAQDKCGKYGADLSAEIPRSGMKAEGATLQISACARMCRPARHNELGLGKNLP
jgi:hypothetical protein